MSDEKQAVVEEAKVPAQQGTEVETRTDDTDPLDALLAEFDQGTKPVITTQTVTPKDDPEIVSKVRNLEAIATNWQKEQDRKAISETITSIRGDVPEELFDDDMIEGWLNALAVKDTRLAVAYANREQNPRAWKKVTADLKGKLADKFGNLPDRAATVDHELVAQSVRGASTKVAAEPAPELGAMSGPQLRKHVMDQYGFDPGV